MLKYRVTARPALGCAVVLCYLICSQVVVGAEEKSNKVIFWVEPASARIFYEATTLSASDQGILLGDGIPGHPIELPANLIRDDRDSFTLVFRDPDGDFESKTEKFNKFDLSSVSRWPESGSLKLQPRTLRGYFLRFWPLITFLSVIACLGTFGFYRLRAQKKAASDAKAAELFARRRAEEADHKKRKADEETEAANNLLALQKKEAEEQRQLAELEAQRQELLLEAARKDPLMGIELKGQGEAVYTTEKMIGKGGMGKVYLARDPDGQKVAIKFSERGLSEVERVVEKLARLNEELEAATVEAKRKDIQREIATSQKSHKILLSQAERLKEEVYVQMGLKHDGFVRCFWGGIYHSYVYLVMELMEGGDLGSRVQEGGRSSHEVIPLLKNVFAALYTAHTRPGKTLVHRDLKPGNIMLTADGIPKVTDFGLVKQSDKQMTGSAMSMGTYEYMAPEQIMDSGKAVPQTDQYALGIMLYELLTGERPFQVAPGADILLLLADHLSAPAPNLPVRDDLSPALNGVIQKMLAKEPADRYPDLRSCYRALLDCLPASA